MTHPKTVLYLNYATKPVALAVVGGVAGDVFWQIVTTDGLHHLAVGVAVAGVVHIWPVDVAEGAVHHGGHEVGMASV